MLGALETKPSCVFPQEMSAEYSPKARFVGSGGLEPSGVPHPLFACCLDFRSFPRFLLVSKTSQGDPLFNAQKQSFPCGL